LLYKLKAINLENEKDKKVIYCPVCKNPVFKNTASLGNVLYRKYSEDWKCEHICCDFYILGHQFNEAPDETQVVGIKYLPNNKAKSLKNIEEVNDFLCERLPNSVVVAADNDCYKFYYFFFKSDSSELAKNVSNWWEDGTLGRPTFWYPSGYNRSKLKVEWKERIPNIIKFYSKWPNGN